MVFLLKRFFYICVIIMLLEISIFLELRFDRILNITKFPFLNIFKMSYLFPNHFSGKLFDYSLFLQLMISNERPFE